MISLRKGASAVAVLMALLVSACNDEATTEPLVPGKLSVVGDASASAPAGFPVTTPFTVKLTTKSGVPLVGQVVRFTAPAGVILSKDSSFTDENGNASVGITPSSTGTFAVTAAANNVASVTFSVTATAPAPKRVLILSGNEQGGIAGEPYLPFQALVLKDDGSAAVGVPVTFAVASGGGSLTATTVNTNANGIASTTLIAGTGATQSVTATAAGAAPVTFTAVLAPCTASRAMTVPGTFTRSLEAGDCQLPNGRYVEYFQFTAGSATAFSISESSTSFVPSLSIRNPAGDTIGFHTPGATPAAFKTFLPAGTYRVGASTSAANATGGYTVTTTTIGATDSSVTGCERVYIARGATSGGQNIAATDCQLSYDDGGGNGTQLHYGDRYRIYLKSGESITIQMSGTADHLIRVINANTGAVALQYDNGVKGTTETTTFTAPSAGQWIIDAATYNNATGGAPPDVGTYRLTIS